MLVAVVLALGLLPVTLLLGAATHTSLVEERAAQLATRHETVAVLTQDAKGMTLGTDPEFASNTSNVRAEWRLPNGTIRYGAVPAQDGQTAGTKVHIWIDQSGNPTTAPMSTIDATVLGVLVAGGGWLVAGGALALGCCGVHRLLDRRRFRAWDAEWDRIEPDWHGWRR